MALANQPPGQPAHCRQVARQPGIRRALNPHHRQPEPTANQRWRQRQPNTRRHHQRHQRRHRVAHPTQQLGEQHVHQQRRHDPHHHVGVGHSVVEYVCRRSQALQGSSCEHATQYRGHQADDCPQQQGGCGDGFHQMRFPRAPGLADEHTRTRAEADDQGDEEKYDGEHARYGCQSLGAEHLADIDAVDGARHGLEEIGENHGGEEKEVGFPEGVLGGRGLHWVEVQLGCGNRILEDSVSDNTQNAVNSSELVRSFQQSGEEGPRTA
ncbi:hypothetical protein EMIT0P253_210067 [Pseudomonas sp. IT-P253]